jgi:transposase
MRARRPLGGDRRSSRIEAHKETILALLKETPDAAIEELRRSLAKEGLVFGEGTVRRFLIRHGITRKKKTAHASEQDRPDVVKRRQDWLDGQPALDPERLVFIDESVLQSNERSSP